MKNIFISEEEMSKLTLLDQSPKAIISYPKASISVILLIIIIAGFLFNQILMWKMNSTGILSKLYSISINITKKNNK